MSGGANTIPETPEQIEQAKVAASQYSDYQKRWGPVIQMFQQRVDQGVDPERSLLEGQSTTDVRGQYGNASKQLNAALRGSGIEVGSGRDIEANNSLGNATASAVGGGKARADAGVDQSYVNGLQQIIGIGKGQQTSANTSLAGLSTESGQAAAAGAETSAEEAAGLGEAIGTGVGAAGTYGLQPYLRSMTTPPNPGTGMAPATPGY